MAAVLQPNVAQPIPPPYAGPPGYEIKQPMPAYPPQQPGYSYSAQPTGTTTTTIVYQQPQLVVGMRFFEYPVSMTCPHCQASIVTATDYTPGTLTWLSCGATALVGCWLGCCLIPFCIDALKDVIHSCPNCKTQVGVYRRM